LKKIKKGRDTTTDQNQQNEIIHKTELIEQIGVRYCLRLLKGKGREAAFL